MGEIAVMIIDQDECARLQMASALADGRYAVDMGQQLCMTSQTRKPDVLLMSFDTLNEPLIESMAQMRKAAGGPSIIASVHCQREIKEAIRAGADDAVLVPVDSDELVRRVEAAASQSVRPSSAGF